MLYLWLCFKFAAESNYMCASGNETIGVDMLCDGMNDCEDNSDENNMLCSGKSCICHMHMLAITFIRCLLFV